MAILPGIPEWEPDTRRALAQLRERARRPRRPRRALYWIAAASAALVAVLILPASFAIAQRLWNRHLQTEGEVIRLNPGSRVGILQAALPLTYTIPPRPPVQVADLEAAGRPAGFIPQRPIKLTVRSMGALLLRDPLQAPIQMWHWGRPSLLNPKVTVSDPVMAQITVRVSDLNAALRTARVNDISLPQKWDGAVIGVEFSPAVLAEYDVVHVAQLLPYSLVWPNDFPVADFVEAGLRILGLTAEDARHARGSFAENPAFFALISAQTQIAIREVPLGMGPLRDPWKAMLFENTGVSKGACGFCPGPAERMLVWSTPDRIFAVTGKLTEDDLVAIAHSIM